MDRRIMLLPLLALAGTSLSGCVAVAIPALAGSALVGTRIDGEEPGDKQRAASAPAPQAPAAAARPAANPVVIVASSATAPAVPAPVAVVAPVAAPVTAAPAVSAPSGAPRPEQFGFSQFVRYGRGVAAVSAGATGPLSAMLADPIALDGQRKRCAAGQQPVAVIDLDPAGGLFAPPADPERNPGPALGLAVLREAGVKIAWLSDLPVAEIGAVRTALEIAGLDLRGEDIVSLRRDAEDRKQARKESLAGTSCIIAIAGDAKPDFDERFQYLRNPEAGAALETAIGDGWFLIEPIFPVAK
jgi:hypothetical protein